jgi:hypothetical protein
MRIFFTLILVPLLAYAGSNSLTSVSGGKVQTTHVNQFYSAFNQNLVPRNSSGVATDIGGDLGQSNLRWEDLFAKKLNVGASASLLFMDENSGKIRFGVGGVGVTEIEATGLNGAGIKDATITSGKHAAAVYGIAAATSGLYTSTSTTFGLVTNQTVAVTTTGRPVKIALMGGTSSGSHSGIYGQCSSCTTFNQWIRLLRNGTEISRQSVGATQSTSGTLRVMVPCGSFDVLDAPRAAGSYTYTLEAAIETGGTVGVSECKLTVMEIF